MTSKEIRRWADEAQYDAEPHSTYAGPDKGVEISVNLLWMTPDPLGAIAAMAAMYEGHVVRDLNEVTNVDRQKAFDNCLKTHLKAPLEAVRFQFLLEGVDRAFTHQQVRQRTAVYAQESMRFAVPGKLTEATTLPPSLQGTQSWDSLPGNPEYYEAMRKGHENQAWRNRWDLCLKSIDEAYHFLVDNGMPAEEARGLLPHCTATRINYNTDLRNLSDQAGNRLCTQAQFPWRDAFAKMMKAIADYNPETFHHDQWQFEMIASSGLFRPVCYQLGHCPFEASFDRKCSIRERVQQNRFLDIRISEWLLDPTAAR